jgi:putative membrane protein
VSEEGKLSVADLLARQGGEQTTSRPRRRRRSLEEGGVSVAELTGNLPVVDSVPEQPRHTSVPLDAELEEALQAQPEDADKADEAAAKPDKPTPAADETKVIPKVKDQPEAKFAAEPADPAVPAVSTSFAPSERTETAQAAGEHPLFDAGDTSSEERDTEALDTEDGARVSILAVILMSAIAVVLGAALFKGFEYLWANMGLPIAPILALLATAGIVGIVHVMRTERDRLSMLLAALAGAVLTFGPALITGIH